MSEPANIIPFRASDAEATPLVDVQAASVTVGGAALLQKTNLTLKSDGITALIGPNGSGKSIFLRLLTGLIHPNSGSVTLSDQIGHPALVFQKPILLRRSVRGNLLHALKIAKVPRKDRTGRLAELLVTAGLTPQAETPARQLSGGQQQRLAIARALAETPKLLLLDEPTANLDPAATMEIEALISETSRDGVKIILVTHNTAQAARLCEDVAFMHKGRILEHTPAKSFFDTPTTTQAQAFVKGELVL